MVDTQHHTPLSITVIGALPPPPGGVASSVKSLFDETRGLDTVDLRVVPWYHMWKLMLRPPDVLHLHFSRPIKRLLGSIIGRILGSGVVQTIHSNNFDFGNLCNRLSNRLVSGTIVLNTDIEHRFRSHGMNNCVLMTPILASRLVTPVQGLDPIIERWLCERSGKVAAVYCSDRRYVGGYDLYGFGFISKLLARLHEMSWSVIFVDPASKWRADELFPVNCPNALHYPADVDFKQLLQRIDVYLRPTATDGNSVAVLEALSLGTPVIASDIVPRPADVQLYRFDDADEFLAQLQQLDTRPAATKTPRLTRVDEYVLFMAHLRS